MKNKNPIFCSFTAALSFLVSLSRREALCWYRNKDFLLAFVRIPGLQFGRYLTIFGVERRKSAAASRTPTTAGKMMSWQRALSPSRFGEGVRG